MNKASDATDWRQLREFAAVDLGRSFLLSCSMDRTTLLVEVDLYLTPDHPFYEKPRPAQKACIRPAVIEFPHCAALTDGQPEAEPDPARTAGRTGHGAISGFRRLADGRYELSGDFGLLLIDAERPLLRLSGL